MPFVARLGNFKQTIGNSGALGTVPGAPTFGVTPASEGDVTIPVTFIAPAFNGRTNNNWLQVCSFNIGR